MHILIVEDNRNDRQLLKLTVEQHGGQGSEAKDGLEALDFLRSQRPDLIVCDALMPRMDGFELLRAVRADPALAQLPFIFYTAVYTESQEEELARSLGADGFLVKPIAPEQLWLNLQELLRQSAVQPRPRPATADAGYYQRYGQMVATKLEQKVVALEAELERRRQLEEERAQLVSDLRQTNHDLQALTDVTSNSFSSLDLDAMLDLFLQRLAKALEADAAAIYLRYGERLRIRAGVGMEQSLASRFSVAIGSGVAGTVAVNREPLYLEDIGDSALVVNPELRQRNLVSLFAVPIVYNRDFLGVVQVGWAQRHPQVPRELRLLEVTAERCGTAISNCQLFELSEETRKHLDLQISRMPAANIVCDPNFRIQSWNPAAERIFGFSAAEAISRHPFDLIVPQQRQAEVAQMWKNLLTKNGQQILQGVKENITKDGRSIFCEWLNTPLRKPDGTLVGVLFMALDVTEQQKSEAKLRQAQKMEAIGTLAGGIAHDFNNILSAIIGYASLVRRKLPDNQHDNIDQVIQAGRRAADLVKQILTFSRQTEQELRPLSVQLIVKEVLKLLRPLLPSSIQIRQEIDESCGEVLADPAQVHQVIMNLCTNAYQAMQEQGGTLKVELKQQTLAANDLFHRQGLSPGDYVLLVVSDTGCGMDQRTREKIFEPYFTTKKARGGTGLGLATVHGIVTSSGGDISAYSEPGKGTTFQVYLPTTGQAGNLQQENTAINELLPTGNERLLLVDDEPALVELNSQLLEELGYQVTAETGSRQALKRFTEQPDSFDLLLTDLTMPGLSGIELARQVHQLRADLPIILATGFSEIDQKDKAREAGICAILMKPILSSELAKTLRATLDKRSIKD